MRRPNRRRQGAGRRWSSLFLVLNGIGLQKSGARYGVPSERRKQAASKRKKNTHHLEVLSGADRGGDDEVFFRLARLDSYDFLFRRKKESRGINRR